MKKIIFLFTATILFMLLGASSTTFAGKIYKWTDSNGKVHYGERAPSGNAKQLRIPTTTPYGATPKPKPSKKTDAASKFLESVATERKEKKEAADKTAKEKEITDKNCSNARRRVASLKQGGRQYEVNEKGERNYLDEAAIQSRLNDAQSKVKKWCK